MKEAKQRFGERLLGPVGLRLDGAFGPEVGHQR